MFEAGEGVVEITPRMGIEMAGFHKPAGQERRITGIRHPPTARALVLRHQKTTVAIVSIDVCGIPADFARRVQQRAAKLTSIPVNNIRVCATHTHSMPTFRFLRQWGAVPKDYMALVEQAAARAVELAKKDLAQADCYLGKDRVLGGNFNRTAKTWKTEDAFTKDSTDTDRWLDRTLHALFFLREKPKRSLLWYHFSAHPVCFTDDKAGPDWPGLVTTKTEARDGLSPSFLQGHCGDVNPGDGNPWTGDAEKVSETVYGALHHATNHSALVKVDTLRLASAEIKIPLDLGMMQDQLALYRKDPAQCDKGEWVDAGFAKDWFASASKWKPGRKHCATTISALQLGDVGLLFHPAELYSYYGLAIRRDSPFENTLVVGYTDDFIGYLTDPNALKAAEYAAVVVPKILDLPPFKPEAASYLAAEAIMQLQKVAK